MPCPRLFHMGIPGRIHARAFRCIWLLEELGVSDFEVCMLRPGEPYAPQMRDYGIRQATKLPTLQIDGQEIGESGVISQLLAERYQARRNLLGAPGERTELLQWIGFAETCISLRVPLMPLLMDPAMSLDDLHEQVVAPQRRVFEGNIDRFETHFGEHGNEYLLDSGFSVADTMCGWSLYLYHAWGLMDLATGRSPLCHAYLERLQARPAFARAEQYATLEPGIHRPGERSAPASGAG